MILAGALRQFRHNNSDGLVIAYDKEIVDKLIAELEYNLGAARIELEHRRTLLVSCEKALQERDQKIIAINDK